MASPTVGFWELRVTDAVTAAAFYTRVLGLVATPWEDQVLLSTPDGAPVLVVDKQKGRSLTEVRRHDGDVVGAFATRRVGRFYAVRDKDGTVVGDVEVDIPRNNFQVRDKDGKKVAHVRKKWAGVVTHLLTTADKYDVEIFDPVPEPLRTMAAVTAIVMDMNLHESKDIT